MRFVSDGPARILIVLVAVILFASCDSGGPLSWTLESQTPHVEGIEMRDAANTSLGLVGRPVSPPALEGLRVNGAYPNPSNWQFQVRYDVVEQSEIRVRVVPASGPGGRGPLQALAVGSVVPAPGVASVRTEQLPSPGFTGSYLWTWDIADQAGRRVADGYYRIFFETALGRTWTDVLVLSDVDWL
jgi:hypothetical protein